MCRRTQAELTDVVLLRGAGASHAGRCLLLLLLLLLPFTSTSIYIMHQATPEANSRRRLLHCTQVRQASAALAGISHGDGMRQGEETSHHLIKSCRARVLRTQQTL